MWKRLNPLLYFHFPPLWRLFARYRCPLFFEVSARECSRRGECGCDNGVRFRS